MLCKNKIIIFLVISLSIASSFTLAGPYSLPESKISPISIQKMNTFASKFFTSGLTTQLSKQTKNYSNNKYCPPLPQPKLCIQEVCRRLSHHQCDDLDEITRVGAACRGNYNGQCLAISCQYLSHHECDDIDELEEIAKACRKNYGGSCLNVACSFLSRHECDDQDEVTRIAKACQHNYDNGDCIKYVCHQLSSHECDDIEEIIQVAQSCNHQ